MYFRPSATAGWQEGRGPWELTRDSIMKPEGGAREVPTSQPGILPSSICYAAIPPPSKLSPDADTLNPKRTPPALGSAQKCTAHPITPLKRGVTVLTWLDASTRIVSSSQSLYGDLQHDLLRCLQANDTEMGICIAVAPRKSDNVRRPPAPRSPTRGLRLCQMSPLRASSST